MTTHFIVIMANSMIVSTLIVFSIKFTLYTATTAINYIVDSY